MPAGQSRPVLSFRNVACLRGGRLLFHRLDLTLLPGAAILLTGANGVGKSSLLRIAAGLLSPFAGQVARTTTIALADENLALDRDLPLDRALRFWAAIDSPGGGDSPEHTVNSALETFGIAHLASVPVRLLSTGQRQRAILARTLASDAGLWLLDEPTNGLDASAVARLEAAIAAFRAGGGALVVASHVALALPGATTLELVPPGAEELSALSPLAAMA